MCRGIKRMGRAVSPKSSAQLAFEKQFREVEMDVFKVFLRLILTNGVLDHRWLIEICHRTLQLIIKMPHSLAPNVNTPALNYIGDIIRKKIRPGSNRVATSFA